MRADVGDVYVAACVSVAADVSLDVYAADYFAVHLGVYV